LIVTNAFGELGSPADCFAGTRIHLLFSRSASEVKSRGVVYDVVV
jgi:hypothetical protein